MRLTRLSRTCALAVASVLACCGAGGPDRGEPFEWQTATPASQDLSGQALDALKDSLAARKTTGLLVIRNDKVVLEWYADGHSASTKHYTASMAKAIVGGVSLGVAVSDGRIALDDRAAKYIPQWKDDPRRSRITIRQLGSHTSGLEDAEQNDLPHTKLTGWKGTFWKQRDVPDDPFTLSRDQATTPFEPGARFQYSNPGIAMLTYAVTASLKDAPERDVRTLLRDRIMRPIGVPDGDWSVGYGKTFKVDGLPLVGSWGGGAATARAVARVGRLMLREGDWDGTPLLSKDAVRQITRDAGTPGHCGMGWWSNNDGQHPRLPNDAFWGAGAGHQVVLVVPSLRLIVVRNGENLDPEADFHEAFNDHLFEPLMKAVPDAAPSTTGRAPYPPSRVIARIDWAGKDEIVRQARGSDNWPITWADDDRLYTAYGDGQGFNPKGPKLSLGLARIEGDPPDVTGRNLPSPTLDQTGEGPAGMKASGLLMVDGVLYLWARNAGNSRLAWSEDHGATWTWSDWKFTAGFGGPTFLNFGKNYAGARDGYAYIYSHDNDSAYQPADRMVLARVPTDRIRRRDAYDFFQGLDGAGTPVWSKEIGDHGAVFTHKQKCYRSGISYHPVLKRYLWCQTLPGADPRFRGGFGIYDAPEPWGPWTTVFYTEDWDVGPGESSSLPTKWMSADGTRLVLVFSGDDSFAVRGATLTLSGK